MKNKILYTLLLFAVIAISGYLFRGELQKLVYSPGDSSVQRGISSDDVLSPTSEEKMIKPTQEQKEDIKILAEGLEIPWEIVFIDQNTMLVTERPGTLLKVTTGGETAEIQEIEGVVHIGEGGLQGMQLHPDFEQNSWVYLYLTTRTQNGLINRVERYIFDENQLSGREVILDNIPGARFHDGGRMEFGPDGKLYITSGDAGNEQNAQVTSSLSGKILRINDDGSVPEDNPFDNEVYSYGHRNPQGLAWDNRDRLWSTEHGPSGLQTGNDELNLIELGENYGWPVIKGMQSREGMKTPVIESGSDDTWAPAGAVYYKNRIFFTGLRGESLYEADITDSNNVTLKGHFREEYGRLRAVVLGPDNFLYITTSNRDGRGDVLDNDDKIIRVNPEIFFR